MEMSLRGGRGAELGWTPQAYPTLMERKAYPALMEETGFLREPKNTNRTIFLCVLCCLEKPFKIYHFGQGSS